MIRPRTIWAKYKKHRDRNAKICLFQAFPPSGKNACWVELWGQECVSLGEHQKSAGITLGVSGLRKLAAACLQMADEIEGSDGM